ncbi:MAG: hypothetical protein WCP73_05995, partial [Eubacteriales bacterium]
MKKWLICIVLFIVLIPSFGFAATPAPSAAPAPSSSASAKSRAQEDADFNAALQDTLFHTDLSGLEGKYDDYLKGLSGKTTQDMVYAVANGDFSSLSPGG